MPSLNHRTQLLRLREPGGPPKVGLSLWCVLSVGSEEGGKGAGFKSWPLGCHGNLSLSQSLGDLGVSEGRLITSWLTALV